jgi:hypothetical protein
MGMIKITKENNLCTVKLEKICQKKFNPNVEITKEEKIKCFNFAFEMATGHKHNPYSFGSKKEEHSREKIEIFRDAFQGKLAEIGFYNFYSKKKHK